jgi:hypothetical protein
LTSKLKALGYFRVRIVRPSRDVVSKQGDADVMQLAAICLNHGPEAVPTSQHHVGLLAGMLDDPSLEDKDYALLEPSRQPYRRRNEVLVLRRLDNRWSSVHYPVVTGEGQEVAENRLTS